MSSLQASAILTPALEHFTAPWGRFESETAMAACVICDRTVALHLTTAGSLYADGSQAFACNKHLIDRAGWAVSWALFEAQQQMSHSRQTVHTDGPHVELHTIATKAKLSLSLAQHLSRRLVVGRAIVVAEEPHRLLCITRKHWLTGVRDVERRRASTLDPEKQHTLTEEINRMNAHQFTAQDPHKAPDADVFFIAPKDLSRLPADAATIYFAAPAIHSHVQDALRHMQPHGLMVTYQR